VTGGHDNVILVWTLDSLGKLKGLGHAILASFVQSC